VNQLSFRAFLNYAERLHNQALDAANLNAAMPYLIGSILTSWISLESFVNNMMQDYAALPDGMFSVHESAFLIEKQVLFNRSGTKAGTFSVGNNQEFRRIEDKMLFLIAKFGNGKIDKGAELWQKFEKVKEKRNTLSHYRKDCDIELTSQDSQEAMELVKELIEFLSKQIRKKPLKW
jgi:hypothetical protein